MLRLILPLLGVFLAMAVFAASWEPTATGAFRLTRTGGFLPEEGRPTLALTLSYPAHTTSEPGQYGEWRTAVPSPGERCSLSFAWHDTFTGPTVGYHVLQLLVNERVAWEGDIAGGGLDPLQVAVPLTAEQLPPAGQPCTVAFRLLDNKQVTNFAVSVQVLSVRLQGAKTDLDLLPPPADALAYGPWPADLPLPALPVVGDWTAQANIIQPWGKTQTTALREAAQWAPKLARDHGLNAIIVLPPDAHNAITHKDGQMGGPHFFTTEQFSEAIGHYRREGMKLILYSSVMHMGHDPKWQFGEIARTHPEWAMRDSAGATVNIYGNPWLCPSTGALQATIDYTAALVRAHDPDGVMLDNNEFMATPEGRWTCHCEACKLAFKAYLTQRFGKQIAGLPDVEYAIPEDETSPLYGLWLSFRNRTWAQACETFRQQLRQIKPDLVLLANTQYVYKTGLLAVDGQYAHLDAVLSESRFLSPEGMAAKMLVGRALASGRPLWNYIGTFDEKDYSLLQPAEHCAGICAASEAVGANPWIVFYGFTGEANQAALEVIRRYLDFWSDQRALLGAAKLQGDVGVIISTESRDLVATPLVSPVLAGLVETGRAVLPVRDAPGVTLDALAGTQVMVATGSPCMREETARVLAEWVKQGGHLIVSPDCAWRDEYGRWRPQSALTPGLGTQLKPGQTLPVGKGRLTCVSDHPAALKAACDAVPPRVQGPAGTGACLHRTQDGRSVLAVAGFEGAPGEVTLRLPGNPAQAQLLMPDHEPQTLAVTQAGNHSVVTCTIPERLGLVVY